MGKEGEGLYSLCVVFFSLAFFPVLFWRTEREIFLPQDPRKKGRVKRAEKSWGFIALRRLREIYGRGCLPPFFGHTERDQTFFVFYACTGYRRVCTHEEYEVEEAEDVLGARGAAVSHHLG